MNLWDIFFEVYKITSFILLLILIVFLGFLIYSFASLLFHNRLDALKDGLPKGYYYKEFPIDTIELIFSTPQRNIESSTSTAFIFEISGYIRKDITKSIKEARTSVLYNKQLIEEAEREFAFFLSHNYLCVFGWEDYFSADYWQKSHNISKVMEKWFNSHKIIKNADGQIAAVKGVSMQTLEIMKKIGQEYDECYYELTIIDVPESEFSRMTVNELEELVNNKSFKFKINNAGFNSCCFEVSDNSGYTKADMIQKAKEFAESKGYKFKIEG